MTSPATLFAAANVIKAGHPSLDTCLALGDLLDAIGEDVQTGKPLCPVGVLVLAASVVATVEADAEVDCG